MKMSRTVRNWSATALAAMAMGILSTGCDRQDHGGGAGSGGHGHASAHGGVAVELGDHQYHLDFVAEPSTGVLKAWVMDAHAENFVRVTNASWSVRITAAGVENELALQAQGNAATGEKEGDSSLFLGQADWLKGVERFTAVVPSIEIRGQTYKDLRFSYPAQ